MAACQICRHPDPHRPHPEGEGWPSTVLRCASCPDGKCQLSADETSPGPTPREILDRVPCYGKDAERRRAELAARATPGTRLWVLPFYYQDGYRELGHAATATGLALSAVEALFGEPGDGRWLVGYRRDDGVEGKHSHQIILTLAEARERWWIVRLDFTGGEDGEGPIQDSRLVLVSGGHADRERMMRLCQDKFPGCLVMQGREFMPET